jgi:hypothetical protein
MTPRGIPALRMLPHMGPATTAPARSVNYIVNHMCEHICEPIQSTGRILPGGPGITMCAENTAYDLFSDYVSRRCLVFGPSGALKASRTNAMMTAPAASAYNAKV